jgi:hypothetical protein
MQAGMIPSKIVVPLHVTRLSTSCLLGGRKVLQTGDVRSAVTPAVTRRQGFHFSPMGLGRLELPTSRLSDMSRALVGAGERWNQGVLAESALVGAGQRWWAMIQVVIQLSLQRPDYSLA